MYLFQQILNSRRYGDLATKDYTPNDRPGTEDCYLHASGKNCEKCHQRIEANQRARRHGESGWVHDLCPPVAD